MKRNDTLRRSLNHRSSKEIIGVNYRPSCGQCKIPAWEICACSDLLALNARAVEPVKIERTADSINLEADRRLSLALT